MGNRYGDPPSDNGGDDDATIDDRPTDGPDAEDDEGRVQDRLPGTGSAAAAGAAAGVAAGAAVGGGKVPETDEPPAPEDEPDEDQESDLDEEPPDEDPLGEPPAEEPTEPPEREVDQEDDEDAAPESEANQDDTPEDDVDLDDEEDARFVYGDIVYDRDAANQDDVDEDELDRYVVVTVPDTSVIEWEVDDGETVADQNPHYPPTDHVILIGVRDVLDELVPSWEERREDIPVEDLEAAEIPYAAFPSLRLELDEPSHLRGPVDVP